MGADPAVDHGALGHAVVAHPVVARDGHGHVRAGRHARSPQLELEAGALHGVRDERLAIGALNAIAAVQQAETALHVAATLVDGRPLPDSVRRCRLSID